MTTTGPEEPRDEQHPPPSTQRFDQQMQNQFGTPRPQQAPPPYGQYGQQPPQYGQQPQQPYGYPQQPYGYRPQAPNHPSAMTAMVLGIVGLVGVLLCGGVTLVLSPFAWAIGSKAVKEIDAAPPGTYGGRDQANGGRIMGIVGTVLLILGVLALSAFIALIAIVDVSSSSSTY